MGPARNGPPSCVQFQTPSTCGFAARNVCSACASSATRSLGSDPKPSNSRRAWNSTIRRCVADREGRVERQVTVEVAHRVLGRHDQVRVVDAAEHGLVGRGVGVQVTDGADPDGPRPEDDVAVVLGRRRQQGLEHRLHGRLRGHRELRRVVPAGLVDGAALADPDHEPVDERHAVEQLGEPRLVDGPQRGVVDGEPADRPLEVASSGGETASMSVSR